VQSAFGKMPQKGLTHLFRSGQPSGAGNDGKRPIRNGSTEDFGLTFGDLVHARIATISRLFGIDSRSLLDDGNPDMIAHHRHAQEAAMMASRSRKRRKKACRISPDLDQAKSAVLNTLSEASARHNHLRLGAVRRLAYEEQSAGY